MQIGRPWGHLSFQRAAARLGAGAVVVALLVAGVAGPAMAEPSIEPSQGLTLGGTPITIRGADLGRARFSQVATGEAFGVGLTEDGQVYAWGDNSYGQLGTGTAGVAYSSAVPVPVKMTGALAGLTVVSVAAGERHVIALTSTGRVFAWGSNFNGQLGLNTTATYRVEPQGIPASSFGSRVIKTITAGGFHGAAIDDLGQAYAWGYNGQAQLGNGNQSDTRAPVRVGIGYLPAIIGIDGGLYHTVAWTAAGAGFAWGLNEAGQLGVGDALAGRLWPTPLKTSSGLGTRAITAMSAGHAHSVALTSDNRGWAWGRNTSGQLGFDGSWAYDPVMLTSTGIGTYVTQIVAGSDHTIATNSQGRPYAWGYNNVGQLGIGNTNTVKSPTAVSWGAEYLGKTVTSIATSGQHSAVSLSDGRIAMWGRNTNGQQGNGDTSGAYGLTPRFVLEHVRYTVHFGAADVYGLAATLNRNPRTLTLTTPRHAAGDVEVQIKPHDRF